MLSPFLGGMKEHLLLLVFLCHVLPQDSNAQRFQEEPYCSLQCQRSCILHGFTGGFCLPTGQCDCHLNGRVVGPLVDVIQPQVHQFQSFQHEPSYFPPGYYDPYQSVRRSPMLELRRTPGPPEPRPVSATFTGGKMPNSLPPEQPTVAGYPSQKRFAPVETMSGDVLLQTKSGKIKKETSEDIGISIGNETPEGEGQQVEMNAGSNSTEYLPPDGKEEQPEIPDAPAKNPSTGGSKDKGPKITTDASGKYVENKMQVNVDGPNGQDVGMELENTIAEEEEQKKTRRKRDVKLSDTEIIANRRQLLAAETHKISERRKLLAEADKKIAAEREMMIIKEKIIQEEEMKLDAADKRVALKSGKPDSGSGKAAGELNGKPDANREENVSKDKLVKESDKQHLAEVKQGVKDDKKQNTEKKKDKKKRKSNPMKAAKNTLKHADAFLESFAKDPVAATSKFFSNDQKGELLPGGLFDS